MDWLSSGKAGGASPSAVFVLFAIAVVALVAAVVVSAGAGAADGSGTAEPVAGSSKGPARQTPKKSIWGGTEHNGRSLFPTYRDLGVGIYSAAARWDQIAPAARPADPTNPNDPAYAWPEHLTEAISEAASYGMQVQVLVLGTPPWANGGQSWKFAPAQPADFGDFATAISRRYPHVSLWMVWGEPNRKPNFGPFTPARRPTGPLSKAEQVAPGVYAQLLEAAYGGFKGVDPADRVIGGNTYTSAGKGDINPYQWIRYMRLPNGARPRMDMYGHNPFGFDKPSLKDPPSPRGSVAFGDLRRLTRELDRAFPGPPLKLFLAEWGVPTGFKDKDLGYSLKPAEAKAWIGAGLRIARSWKRVYTLGWIHPVDTNRSSMGLLDSRGKRKPTYGAYKAG